MTDHVNVIPIVAILLILAMLTDEVMKAESGSKLKQ